MARYANQGYILHQSPFQNTSLLLDVFTVERGRVRLVYRGGQKKGVELFTSYWFDYQQKSDLGTLYSAQAHGSRALFQGQRLFCGLYLNELLVKLIDLVSPLPNLYQAYQYCLSQLSQGEPVEASLRQFERQLLIDLGVGFSLTHEGKTGQPIDKDAWYTFAPNSGLVKACHSGIKQEHYHYLGQAILDIGLGLLDNEQTRKTAKRLFRQAISELLDGKPLMSRALFN